MLIKVRRISGFAAVLVVMGSLVSAADFVAPAEGPVAFRRDQIPLDPDTIAGLSRQLGTLAEAMAPTTAAERRGAAQMLALASALDPGNTAARERITEFQLGTHQPRQDASQVERAKLKIWQYTSWLATPEAGPQGAALSACLSDVMAICDPEHPRAAELKKAGERGAWGGWIPPLAAYEAKAAPSTDQGPVPDETPKPDTVPEEMPKPDTVQDEIKLTKATVTTPVWQLSGKGESAKWKIVTMPVEMAVMKARHGPHAQASDNSAGFNITIRANEEVRTTVALEDDLENCLKSLHGTLPSGRSLTISTEKSKRVWWSGGRSTNTAAFAVLANAAITGREPEGIIIGLIDQKGNYTLPVNLWDQLKSIQKSDTGRLILPAAAAEVLPSILAMEQPQFFLDHEVVLAADFKELIELSAKVPNELISKASAKFQEIRSKAGSQPIGQYLANSFIRRRLADISMEAPYHISAKMLAIQGAGNRPTQISKPILVAELRQAIAPMSWLATLNLNAKEIPLDLVSRTYETVRTDVHGLDRYVEKQDQPLLAEVQEMVALLRPLERAYKARGPDFSIETSFETAKVPLIKNYQEVVNLLADPAADLPPDRIR